MISRLLLALDLLRIGSMTFQVGPWELSISAAIGAGTAWLLEWPPVVSAALGVILVPLVAGVFIGLTSGSRADIPPRGLCRCGHPMSMHCHADGSGPCAVAECGCAGLES